MSEAMNLIEAMKLTALTLITVLLLTNQITLLVINHKLTAINRRNDIIHCVRVNENGDEFDDIDDDTESTASVSDESDEETIAQVNGASQTDIVQDAANGATQTDIVQDAN